MTRPVISSRLVFSAVLDTEWYRSLVGLSTSKSTGTPSSERLFGVIFTSAHQTEPGTLGLSRYVYCVQCTAGFLTERV